MNRFSFFLLAVLVFMLNACENKDSQLVVKSPDGKIAIQINDANGIITYALLNEGETLVHQSELSILPDVLAEIEGSKLHVGDDLWKPVWGQFSEIRNHYNELVIDIKLENVKAKLYARVYNQGIGFRYILEGYKEGAEATLYTEYKLDAKDALYCPAGEKVPLGPITVEELLNATEKESKLVTPIVVENSKKPYLSILESDLYGSAHGFSVIKFEFDKNKKILVSSNKVKLEGDKHVTPWRVILVNEKIGGLVTNTVPVNLATPCKIEDPSWIKPGKTLWDWRVHGYKTADGFTYGVNTESYFRFIDFAADKGIEYFLIDANWFTKVTKGHFDVSDELDLVKVSEYAKLKGVDLILYYDRHKGDFGDEELFAYYKSLGMSGIKYGFMGNKVSFTRGAIEKSAENQLLVDFHDGPVPFTGIQRTFPNAITREYCHAQQDSRRAFTPETFIKMALINAIQGPLDMNNGNFDLININKGSREKGPRKQNSYYSTVASEAARTLIIFSGLMCIPDAPEAYNKKADLFEFIKELPGGKWDESMVLHAEIDKYISTARRHGEEWFVGSVSSQQGATLDIDLGFLKEDKNYVVTYYEDTQETHCKTNPEAYQIRKGSVKKGDIIKATMAPGGGHCMWIRPE